MKTRKDRIVSLFFTILVILFSGCSNSKELKTTSSSYYFGDTESPDPLHIYIDIQHSVGSDAGRDYFLARDAMEQLLSRLRSNLGIEDILIEFIPRKLSSEDSGERAAVISRLRVEMMAGEGPDVFVVSYKTLPDAMGIISADDVLFKSPQSAMENGLFLSLEEYIENDTQYTEWKKFPKAIMDAGRNCEGQQIIPLTYTMPVIVYPKEVFDYTPDENLSWYDLLTDPKLAPFAIDLINSVDYEVGSANNLMPFNEPYLEFIIGQTANYEEEKLMFTKEEILQRINEILALEKKDLNIDAEEQMLNTNVRSYNYPITLLPIYSDDGGVTARIDSYAVVNRNTDRPAEAFKVIDTLLSTEVQQSYKIFTEYLCNQSIGGFPINEELYKMDTRTQLYVKEENYYEVSNLQRQITNAKFHDVHSSLLELMYLNSASIPENTEKEVFEVYEDMQRRLKE